MSTIHYDTHTLSHMHVHTHTHVHTCTHTHTHTHTHTGLDDKPALPKILRFPGCNGHINLPQRIGSDCFSFGVFLLDDETGARTKAIMVTHQGNPNHINCDIFTEWLQGSGAQPVTWRTLVTILRQTGLVALADEIEGNLSR